MARSSARSNGSGVIIAYVKDRRAVDPGRWRRQRGDRPAMAREPTCCFAGPVAAGWPAPLQLVPLLTKQLG